jgi:hypothetical protein
MRNRIVNVIIIGIVLYGCWYFFYSGPVPDTGKRPDPPSTPPQTTMPQEQEKVHLPPDRSEAFFEKNKTKAVMDHPKDIQAIKKQIYDLNIEYVEDIPLLDSVVQTGNAPTKDFWQGNWASVDDSKEDINGFFLRPQEDGTYVFFPDENTTRTYTFFETPKTYAYDPVKKEFYWELDYYGKIISHRARFINDNVLVTMLISGRKVALDIYQKQKEPAGQENLPGSEQ